MNAIFDVSPIPTQTMKSGSIASGGIGRRISTIGSSRLRTTGKCPAGSPRASARRAPVAKPTTTRSSVAATWPQSWPVAASSATFPRTRHGPARKIGLKRFPSTTSPDARLHTRRKATTAPARRTHARPRGSGAPWSPHSTRSVTVFTNLTSSRRAHGVTASAAAVWWTYLTRGAAGQDGAEALYCAAMGDLLLRRGVVDGRRRDVAIRDGRIRRLGVDLDPTGYDALDVTDKLVLSGFVESHIHPDKAFIADRTEGLRAGGPSAQTLVVELKKAFTVDDVYRRARRVMELAVRHGCTTMRAHVEIDAFVELRGVEALRRLQADFAGVLDLELIAFAQEGIFHDSVTRDLLREALKAGLKTPGGCPYMDGDQRAHIDWFFETAQGFGVPLDFHADSGDDPAQLTTSYIADQTLARGMQGRVTLGHLCLLDVLEPEHRARVIDRIREAGIHAISLPATELHVKARTDARRTWRGVTRIGELREAGVNVSISTNNIVNPFTPYGHPDLLRQALVTAMAAHLGNLDQLAWLPELITINPARALGLSGYGLAAGCRADLVLLDARDAAPAIPEQARKLYVLKAGRIVARNTRTSELSLPRRG